MDWFTLLAVAAFWAWVINLIVKAIGNRHAGPWGTNGQRARAMQRAHESEINQAVRSYSEKRDRSAAKRYRRAAIKAYRRDDYPKAIKRFQSALQLVVDLDAADPQLLATLDTWMILSNIRGRFGDPERMLAHLIEVQKKVLGPDHPEVARSREKLKQLHRETSREATPTLSDSENQAAKYTYESFVRDATVHIFVFPWVRYRVALVQRLRYVEIYALARWRRVFWRVSQTYVIDALALGVCLTSGFIVATFIAYLLPWYLSIVLIFLLAWPFYFLSAVFISRVWYHRWWKLAEYLTAACIADEELYERTVGTDVFPLLTAYQAWK